MYQRLYANDNDDEEVTKKTSIPLRWMEPRSTVSTPVLVFTSLLFSLTAFLILGIFMYEFSRGRASTTVRQFAPSMGTKTVVFEKTPELMDEPNDISNHYWDSLMPEGFGFVNISNPDAYGIPPGISTPSGIDRYSVAMYHQYHCLGLLRHKYWQLIRMVGLPASEQQRIVQAQLRDKHSQHCFAYIAESILCSGDLTIEWAKIESDGSRRQVDGWGIGHECKDPDAIKEWMQQNHGPINGHKHLHG